MAVDTQFIVITALQKDDGIRAGHVWRNDAGGRRFELVSVRFHTTNTLPRDLNQEIPNLHQEI